MDVTGGDQPAAPPQEQNDSFEHKPSSSAFTSTVTCRLLPEESVVSSTSSSDVTPLLGDQWVLMQPSLTSANLAEAEVQTESDGRIYKCDQCGRQFRQKTTLQQHERTHSDSRPYACSECSKCFRQQGHLKQHLRIHLQEKPYSCEFCKRTFRQRAILDQHLRIHSGEKPYECPECGKFFRQKAILDQHIRTHMGKKSPQQSKKNSSKISVSSPSSSSLKAPVVTIEVVDLTVDHSISTKKIQI
jgi:uncharacterized Zn-finger protein